MKTSIVTVRALSELILLYHITKLLFNYGIVMNSYVMFTVLAISATYTCTCTMSCVILYIQCSTEFPQESELRSETSAAVPHPTKVSLSQVKVTCAPTASAQQSKIVISEVPAG